MMVEEEGVVNVSLCHLVNFNMSHASVNKGLSIIIFLRLTTGSLKLNRYLGLRQFYIVVWLNGLWFSYCGLLLYYVVCGSIPRCAYLF